MKLIIAIIRDNDNDPVSHALTSASYRVTCIASTGGFLRKGMSTLLIGVDDDQVQHALEIVKSACGPVTEPDQKRGTIFVLNVYQYHQF
jgi:uncharacterized protein YaaQ